jgi:hypothetical protein
VEVIREADPVKKILKALEEFYYDGATRKIGDEFEAVDPDATILTVLKKAEDVGVREVVKKPPPQKPAPQKPAPQKLETTDLEAEKPAPEQVDEPMTTENSGLESTTRKRRYLRRDMTAKE